MDINDFSVKADTPKTVSSFPTLNISFTISDPNGKGNKDFSGANTLVFPNFVATLSAAERLDLVKCITQWYISNKLAN